MSEQLELIIAAKNQTDAAFKAVIENIKRTEEQSKKTQSGFDGMRKSLNQWATGDSAKVSDSFSSLSASMKTVGMLGGAIVAGVSAASAALLALGARGADVADVSGQFDLLNQQIGNTGDVAGKLRSAFAGTVSDFDLMKSTNKGLSLGLKLTTGEMELTGKTARVLADRVGGDAAQAYETLLMAMATGQDRTLKGIGLNIDAEAAVAAHARALGKEKDELTEAEQATAKRNAILGELNRTLAASGEAEVDFADRIAQVKTGVENVTDSIGVAIASSPVLNVALGEVADSLLEAFGENKQETIRVLIGYVNEFAIVIAKSALVGIEGARWIARAWEGLKVIFNGVAAIQVKVWSMIVQGITKVLEWASKIPGIGDQFKYASSFAQAFATDLDELSDGFRTQAEMALDSAAANEAAFDKASASASGLITKMEASSSTTGKLATAGKAAAGGMRELGGATTTTSKQIDAFNKEAKELGAVLEGAFKNGIPIDKIEEQFGSGLDDMLVKAKALGQQLPPIFQKAFEDIQQFRIAEALRPALAEAEAVQRDYETRLLELTATSHEDRLELIQRAHEDALAGLKKNLEAQEKEWKAKGGIPPELMAKLKVQADAINAYFEQLKIDEIWDKKIAKFDDLGQVIGIVDHALEEFGVTSDNVFRSMIAGIEAGIDGYKEMAAATKKAKAGGGKGDQYAAAGNAAIGIATSGYQDGQEHGKTGGTLRGAGKGAVTGAMVGTAIAPGIGTVVGAVAGAVIGGVAGWIGGNSDVAKAGEEFSKVFGEKASKEMKKQIADMSKDLGIGLHEATLLALPAALEEMGAYAHEAGAQVMELMTGVKNGSIPAREGIEAIGETFSMVVDEAADAGIVGDALAVGMLKAAKATGMLTAQMKEFLSAQAQAAAQGAVDIAKGMAGITSVFEDGKLVEGATDTTLLKSLGKEWGEDTATFFQYGFQQAINENGILGALDMVGEDFDTFYKAMQEAGNEAALAILGPVKTLQDKLGDGPLRGMLETFEGNAKVFRAMAESGDVTAKSFEAMERQIQSASKALDDGGIKGDAALQAIYGPLRDVVSAAQQYGYELDENTQKLVDQAKDAGFAFPVDPIIQVRDAIWELTEAITGIPRDIKINTSFTTTGTPPPDSPINYNTGGSGNMGANGPPLPGHAHGGVSTTPHPVMVHGSPSNPELIAPVNALAQAIGAGLAANLPQGGGGIQSANLILNGQVFGQLIFQLSKTGDLRIAETSVVSA